MEHAQAEDLLSEYLEGGLEAEQRRRLEEHLQECAACRRDLSLLSRSLELMRRLPRVEAPPLFAQRLLRRARRRGLLSTRLHHQWPRWVIPFQTVILVLLAMLTAVVLIMLLDDHPLPLEVEEPSCLLVLSGAADVNALAESAWFCRGKVRFAGREVPRGARLMGKDQLTLHLAPAELMCLRQEIERRLPGQVSFECRPSAPPRKEITLKVEFSPPVPPNE